VFGARGEPFLRVGPRGVEANVRSTTWWESARSTSDRRAPDGAGDEPEWRRVAQVPRYGWIEPRAAASDTSNAAPPSGGANVRTWEVPMQLGDEPLHVAGVVSWRPLERAN
jgi:hypothetical protein